MGRVLNLRLTKNMAYSKLERQTRIPCTFNDKILFKMAFDRRKILKDFADKWQVRQYVEDKIGQRYLPISYGYSSIRLSHFPLGLPEEFAVKATHTSGGSVLAWEGSSSESRLPQHGRSDLNRYRVSPQNLEREDLLDHINAWLDIDFSWHINLRNPEWAYDGIARGILFEELLLDDGKIPQDYKLFVFNGKVKMIRVDSPDATGKKCMNHFDTKWNDLNLNFRVGRKEIYTPLSGTLAPPSNLEDMLLIAEELSGGIDFVRVDLYSFNNRIYFGELTNYPSAGQGIFSPSEFNHQLGGYFKSDNYLIHEK